jgi:hypothetical protein
MFFLCLAALIAGTLLCYARSGMELMGLDFDELVDFTSNSTGASWIKDKQLDAVTAVDSNSDDTYQVGFWFMVVFDLIFVVAAVTMRKRIRLAITIVREASGMLAEMPLIVLFPFITIAVQARRVPPSRPSSPPSTRAPTQPPPPRRRSACSSCGSRSRSRSR